MKKDRKLVSKLRTRRIAFRHRAVANRFRAHAEQNGLAPADAERLTILIQLILKAKQLDRQLAIGSGAQALRLARPQRSQYRGTDSSIRRLLTTDDVLLAWVMGTRHATGQDLFARFSREGAPSELASNPPKEANYYHLL